MVRIFRQQNGHSLNSRADITCSEDLQTAGGTTSSSDIASPSPCTFFTDIKTVLLEALNSNFKVKT